MQIATKLQRVPGASDDTGAGADTLRQGHESSATLIASAEYELEQVKAAFAEARLPPLAAPRFKRYRAA